jgi:hypothetical protein
MVFTSRITRIRSVKRQPDLDSAHYTNALSQYGPTSMGPYGPERVWRTR